jgi:AcrR family transcriptional regulator
VAVARRSGRRPADSGTRDLIESAARRQFAANGYDRTSLRSIAAEAEVDPALVSYFFGSKQQLFVAVVGLPFDPDDVVPLVFGGDPGTAGERLARFVVAALDDDDTGDRIVGLVRAAASEPEAAAMVRELVDRRLVGRVAAALGVEDAGVRASLVASQLVGLVVARRIVRIGPLASLPARDVVRAVAPTLQRYLTGPL